MAGEVAGLEFSFLTTRGPHLSRGSLFPSSSPRIPSAREGTGRRRDCLTMTMGVGGDRGQF